MAANNVQRITRGWLCRKSKGLRPWPGLEATLKRQHCSIGVVRQAHLDPRERGTVLGKGPTFTHGRDKTTLMTQIGDDNHRLAMDNKAANGGIIDPSWQSTNGRCVHSLAHGPGSEALIVSDNSSGVLTARSCPPRRGLELIAVHKPHCNTSAERGRALDGEGDRMEVHADSPGGGDAGLVEQVHRDAKMMVTSGDALGEGKTDEDPDGGGDSGSVEQN